MVLIVYYLISSINLPSWYTLIPSILIGNFNTPEFKTFKKDYLTYSSKHIGPIYKVDFYLSF